MKQPTSRKHVGEVIVSVLAREALLAGATLEQLALETGRDGRDIRRMLKRLDAIENLADELDNERRKSVDLG